MKKAEWKKWKISYSEMSGFAYVIESKDKNESTLKQLDDYSILNNKYDTIFNKK